MIDTVVLLLEEGKFMVLEPEKFEPPAYWCSPVKNNLKYGNIPQNYWSKQNQTPKELSDEIYKPRLTLFKGFIERRIRTTLLKIEVSLPKLLYGNNFDELTDKDFSAIVEKLALVLQQMGVNVYKHDLRYANTCTIHYSKNFILDESTTSQEIIKEISKGNYSLQQDVEKATYRNAGNLFKLHTNSWEFAIYDKIKDLQKAKISNKRSEEDDNQIQLNFLEKIKAMPSLEVLRIEARLNKRKMIRNLLKKLNIQSGTRLIDLYSENIAKQVLIYYLNELKTAHPDILNYEPTKDIFSLPEFISNNPHLKLREQILFYGFMTALRSHDMREIKELLKNEKSKRSWYRLLEATKKLNLPQKKNFFDYLETKLKEFKPLAFEQLTENYYKHT